MRLKWPKLPFFRKRAGVDTIKSVDEGKLAYLESVRGLAALVVVINHIIIAFYPAGFDGLHTVPVHNRVLEGLLHGFPLGFLIAGNFAVVLFFILSGYVLTYKFFQNHDPHDLRRQAAKRLLRLGVPVFFTVMLSYILIINGSFTNWKLHEITSSPQAGWIFNFMPTLADALYNATVGVFLGTGTKYNPVLWTMPVELIGSFVVFGFALLVGTLKRRYVFYIGAIVLLQSSFMTCFILGALLADITHNTNVITFFKTKVSSVYAYTALGIAYLIACTPIVGKDFADTVYGRILPDATSAFGAYYLWLFFGAFILLFAVLVLPKLQAILNKKLFVWLGGLSFSIYLTHFLILYSLGSWIFLSVHSTIGYGKAALLAAAVTCVSTLIASIVWKKYIDDLSISASRWFADIIMKK